jgi:hypothetical protein
VSFLRVIRACLHTFHTTKTKFFTIMWPYYTTSFRRIPIYLSICPSVRPSVRPPARPSVCLSVYLCGALQPFSWPIFQFLNIYTVGRTPWTGDQPAARPLPTHRTTQTQIKSTQTSMPRVGFEHTTPVFERAKMDRTASVIGEFPSSCTFSSRSAVASSQTRLSFFPILQVTLFGI